MRDILFGELKLTSIFAGFGKTSSASTVENSLLLFLSGDNQRTAMGMIIWRKCSIRVPKLHVCQVGFHGFCREHRDVLYAEGFEYMLLHVII
jgi:hypothetical protein